MWQVQVNICFIHSSCVHLLLTVTHLNAIADPEDVMFVTQKVTNRFFMKMLGLLPWRRSALSECISSSSIYSNTIIL